MNENLYIVIMAGGEGIRFQPLSTPEKPKQFLSFWGKRTFIQHTYDRIAALVPPENVYVATNERYVGLVHEQLPEVPVGNIIGEPVKKNTAPCIAYASAIIAERNRDALVLVLPSDHVILMEEEFLGIIDRAIYIAKMRDVLVTLGIQPTWPADCYGYIKMDRLIEDDPDGKWNVYTVDRFVEKPVVEQAQEYIDEGYYVWNSGMFLWKASMILCEIEKYLPEMKKLLNRYLADRQIRPFFEEAQSISIDYGVMEKSTRVVTIPCNIGWSDIGTWESLYNLQKSAGVELEPHVVQVMNEQLDVRG